MKKDVKYSLFAFLLSATMVFASNGEDESRSKVVNFTIGQLQDFNQISIKDDAGVILYSDFLKDNSKSGIRMDFSKLPVGNYFVELESSIKTVVYPLEVNGQSARLNTVEKTVVFKPFVRLQNNLLDVMGFNPNRQNMEVFIYNEAGEVIFNETISDALELKKRYALKNLSDASVSIKVVKDGKSFNFSFKS
jgi:hypothetical protein